MSRQQRVVIAILFLLLVGNISTLALIDHRVNELDTEVDTIRTQNEQYKDELVALYDNGTSPTGALSSAHTVEVPLPMYDTQERAGVITPMTVTSIAGEGTYVRVDKVTYRETIQESIPGVKRYISQHSVYTLPHEAVIVSIEPKEGWQFVNGDSLQLPLTLGLLATTPNQTLDNSVVATGAVSESGEIQPVGNIPSKAEAAQDAGYDTILVPPGQSTRVDGIEVVEVATVEEAVEYAIVSDN